MWLVSTLLFDHWFENLSDAFCFYEASPKTRTYPRLDAYVASSNPFSRTYA